MVVTWRVLARAMPLRMYQVLHYRYLFNAFYQINFAFYDTYFQSPVGQFFSSFTIGSSTRRMLIKSKNSPQTRLDITRSENEMISKFILEKVILPKILEKEKPKKTVTRKRPIPVREVKVAEDMKSVTRDRTESAVTKPEKPKMTIKRKMPAKKAPKEPTHKEQACNTDDMSKCLPPLKPVKKAEPKPKPRVLSKKAASKPIEMKKKLEIPEQIPEEHIEEIGDATLARPHLIADQFDGLSISEITVKFSRAS